MAAAKTSFSSHGFRGATIRAIAADAGVDPALVMHYFGTKADLYAAAIELPISPSMVESLLLAGPRMEIGERLARLFFSVWEQPAAREPFVAMLRGAVSGHDIATSAFADFITSALMETMAAHLEVPTAQVQAGVANMVGVALMRYVVGIEPIASADTEELIAMLAPRIQSYLVP